MSKIIFIIASYLFSVCGLVLGQGSSYAGSYLQSARIEYENKSNFIIKGIAIGNTTNHCIILRNCHNVTIKNCKFGPSPAYLGIYLFGCSNVKVTDCSFENLSSAMIASSCTSNIRFEYNDVKNIQGPSKGGDSAWGQMVQFIKVSGMGHLISYNACENIAGASAPEDIVNMYDSNGTSNSPIKISNNWIRGGGPSVSGGGIMLGDGGGSYILVEENILVDPGQYGIGVASGHHITVRNNIVYGGKQEFTNVGLYAWEQYNLGCHDITIANNEVYYINKNGKEAAFWHGGNCGIIEGWYTNIQNSRLNATVLPPRIIERAKHPAPIWTSVWPSATEVVKNGFTACVNLNEAGVSYYVVLPTGSVPPNSDQVKAGKDASWNLLADNLKGSISCNSAAVEYKAHISGLSGNASYDVYFVAENKDLILQPSPLRVVVKIR